MKTTHLAALIGTGALALAGAAQATGALDAKGPSYDPGTRPVVSPVDRPSAAQLAVASALTDADRGPRPATLEAALSVGTLYEAGVTSKSLVVAAGDGAGRQTGIAAARGDKLCVVGIDTRGAGGQCGSPDEVAAGRVFTAGFEDGTLRIYGIAANGVTTATFVAGDGTRTAAKVKKNTYLLTVSPESAGTLELSGSQPTVQSVIPDSTPPTGPVVLDEKR